MTNIYIIRIFTNGMGSDRHHRLIMISVLVLLLLPVGMAAVQSNETRATASDLRQSATNVTFITTQGGSAHVYEHAGVLAAVHTQTRQLIWKHDKYRRYMDVDPLDSNRLLVVAGERTGSGSFRRVAVVLNWRTGEELQKFEVPRDTHDIDYLGGDRYVVADKKNPPAEEYRRNGRVFVYNATTDKIVWEYLFINHYPSYPEAGGQETGYTHLNDVDTIDNGSAFLVSPRNFDRVMAIDRKTKETRWTLGEEDKYEILHEQHNPVLLQQDPLTVLVADSENNRIVEYQRTPNGMWNLTWSYSSNLWWPRDADRLPNGNTLVTDTANDRVIEVTPDREIVWEYTIERSPYDVERLQYGDEPAGPPMTEFRDQFDGAAHQQPEPSMLFTPINRLESSYNRLYQLVGGWLLPNFAGAGEFGFVLLATLGAVGWLGIEIVIRLPVERLRQTLSLPTVDRRIVASAGTLTIILGGSMWWIAIADSGLTGVYVATGVLLTNIGYARVRPWFQKYDTMATERIDTAVRIGLVVGSLAVCGLLIYSQVTANARILLYGGLGIAVAVTAADLLDT